MKRRNILLRLCAGAAATAVATTGAAAGRRASDSIAHGFHARVKAKPGMGNAVIELLFQAPVFTHSDCRVFLIGRSKGDPDLIFVTEGWTTEEAHTRFTQTEVAKKYTARFGPLVDDWSTVDEVPIGGKAVLK